MRYETADVPVLALQLRAGQVTISGLLQNAVASGLAFDRALEHSRKLIAHLYALEYMTESQYRDALVTLEAEAARYA